MPRATTLRTTNLPWSVVAQRFDLGER
jgi:hypothetical protein